MEINKNISSMEIIPRIKKPDTLYQKIYDYLKIKILQNELQSGDVVNETQLAQAFATSRSPVRDAIKMLEQEGLLIQSGNSKVVSGFNWGDINNLIEIRKPLELMVYDLAIKNINKKDIYNLHLLIDEMKKVKNNDNYNLIKFDTEFHKYFAEITNNKMLINIMSSVYDQLIRTSMISTLRFGWNKEKNIGYHTDILNCLKSNNFKKGREELINHVNIWSDALYEMKDRLNK
ncbi:GntR family transcriptional regulator [Peptoniphilus sp. ING2-D1G]|nr:GntR family transcriptional regulator [Peptoniphilus sp. ING2-D1G]